MTIEQLVKELNSPAYKTEDKKIMLLRKYLKTDYLDYVRSSPSAMVALNNVKCTVMSGYS